MFRQPDYVTGLPRNSQLHLNYQHYVTGIQPSLPSPNLLPTFDVPPVPDYHTGLPPNSALHTNYSHYVTGIDPRQW